MLFSDAYIKGTSGELLLHIVERTTCYHGRCNTHYGLVLSSQLTEGTSKNILKLRLLLLLRQEHTRSGIKLAWGMKKRLPLFCLLVALALGGANMYQLYSKEVSCLPKYREQLLKGVPIIATQILYL